MKILRNVFFAFSMCMLFFACEQNNVEAQDNLDLSGIGIDLNLDLSGMVQLDQEYPIDESIKSFFIKAYDEINELEENLELKLLQKADGNFFLIQEITEENPNGRIMVEGLETVCKTCRSRKCVVNTLEEAIGDGSDDVDITYRRKTFGAEVCYTKFTDGQ